MLAARLSLVAIFLLGQLGGLIHQATVAHTRCPEDGELIDADSAEARAPERAEGVEAWAAALARGEAVPDEARQSPNAPRHHHDHCAIACASHERATGRAQVLAVAGVDPPPLPCAIPAAAERSSRITLYHVAPKTSPPA